MWSIVNEAARRWLVACSEAERKQVARRQQDCWLGLRRARAGSAAVPADAADRPLAAHQAAPRGTDETDRGRDGGDTMLRDGRLLRRRLSV
jgi:hypothetical protein